MIRTLVAAAFLGAVTSAAAVGAAPVAIADPPYANCTEAHEDGAFNIPSDDPAYRTSSTAMATGTPASQSPSR